MSAKKVIEIFQDILDVDLDSLSLDATPETITEWDSMATVNITVAIEEEFELKFKLEDIQNLKNISDFVNLVTKYKL